MTIGDVVQSLDEVFESAPAMKAGESMVGYQRRKGTKRYVHIIPITACGRDTVDDIIYKLKEMYPQVKFQNDYELKTKGRVQIHNIVMIAEGETEVVNGIQKRMKSIFAGRRNSSGTKRPNYKAIASFDDDYQRVRMANYVAQRRKAAIAAKASKAAAKKKTATKKKPTRRKV
jgi:hypothetical protein